MRWALAHRTEIALALLGAILFAVATNTQTGWLYVLSASIFGALLTGFLISRREIKDCQVQLDWPAHGRVGDPLELRLGLSLPRASGRFPIMLAVNRQSWEALTTAGRVRAVTGSNPALSFRLQPARRGAHTSLTVTVSSLAPFGWFPAHRKLTVKAPRELVVYPPCLPLHAQPASKGAQRSEQGTGQALAGRRVGSDGELHRLRNYVPGDDMRRVHWASSARSQTLMVREMTPEPGRGQWIVIDQAAGCLRDADDPGNPLEQAILRAASWVGMCQKNQRPVVLITADNARLRYARDGQMETLARLECAGSLTPEQVAGQLSPAGNAVLWLGARPIPSGLRAAHPDWEFEEFQ